MKPITKCILYGYNKSVQLFVEEEEKNEKTGISYSSKIFIVLMSERDINGDLQNIEEYRYKDYMKAVYHIHNVLDNFVYCDLNNNNIILT